MTKRADPDDLGTDAAAHLMTYDAWNRLVKITDNAPGTPATIATYEYDGLGRRIEKTVGSDTWDYYHSSSWQVLEVRKNDDTDPEERFVYDGTYIDAPFMRYVPRPWKQWGGKPSPRLNAHGSTVMNRSGWLTSVVGMRRRVGRWTQAQQQRGKH